MLQHFTIFLFGDVQGVFLRRTVKREAERLGISGFVKNEKDGSVRIEAEGADEALDGLVSWLKGGADEGVHKILRVEVDEGKFQAFEGFEVR